MVDEILAVVSPYALGRGECTLASALARECGARGETVALAESCTAGLASAMLCEVAGASAWYRGGVVSYSNELKSALLGVPAPTIERHGAVSAETAEAMARGAIERLGASSAASITGVAGPSGGSDAKPVGTVFLATARRIGGDTELHARRFLFPGDRVAIRDRAAKAAIGALRFHLRGECRTPLLWQERSAESNR
ncbi:MAG: nicotinamide-nucleotide amidohydrolase family protein [Phycisphaerae bacterium]|nr:nicotinamide-nucleotide amidohydrolase family protein [Phycisphaerae bacterium]